MLIFLQFKELINKENLITFECDCSYSFNKLKTTNFHYQIIRFVREQFALICCNVQTIIRHDIVPAPIWKNKPLKFNAWQQQLEKLDHSFHYRIFQSLADSSLYLRNFLSSFRFDIPPPFLVNLLDINLCSRHGEHRRFARFSLKVYKVCQGDL